jgi:hypothetical protein
MFRSSGIGLEHRLPAGQGASLGTRTLNGSNSTATPCPSGPKCSPQRAGGMEKVALKPTSITTSLYLRATSLPSRRVRVILLSYPLSFNTSLVAFSETERLRRLPKPKPATAERHPAIQGQETHTRSQLTLAISSPWSTTAPPSPEGSTIQTSRKGRPARNCPR